MTKTRHRKPKIRNEIKHVIPELKSAPERAYLTFIPGITSDQTTYDFLKEYYRNHKFGRSFLTDGLGIDIRMLMVESSARRMLNHCFEFRQEKEVMGLIIGNIFKYDGMTISMGKDIVTSDLDASIINVRFNNFERLFAELDNLNYDYQILGWYHSHPGHTCFMSPTDVTTQKRMFKHPYQY
jgi:proteasome lid subunit RPN8/RPN11